MGGSLCVRDVCGCLICRCEAVGRVGRYVLLKFSFQCAAEAACKEKGFSLLVILARELRLEPIRRRT